MFPIQSLLLHRLQEDLHLIKTDSSDQQIMARKEQLNLTKRKVENLKENTDSNAVNEKFQFKLEEVNQIIDQMRTKEIQNPYSLFS